MSLEQRLILFWIFIVFFSLIGIAALLTIVGIVKTEPSFRKWAVAGFAAGVAGVVFIWPKAEQPLDFHVILRAPQGLEAQAFELVSGRYEYAADMGKPGPSSGPLELTLGQELGSWEAKFPSRGISSAVKLNAAEQHRPILEGRPLRSQLQPQIIDPDPGAARQHRHARADAVAVDQRPGGRGRT